MTKSVIQKINEQEYKNLSFYRSAIRKDRAMQDARQRFEKWYVEDMKSYAGPLTKMENGQYLYVEMLWRAFEAGSKHGV